MFDNSFPACPPPPFFCLKWILGPLPSLLAYTVYPDSQIGIETTLDEQVQEQLCEASARFAWTKIKHICELDL